MIKKIAIIRLSALGDIIHTIPAIWLIKKKLPTVEITWFVEKGNEKLLKCFKPFINIEIVSLRKQGLKDVVKEILRLRKIFKNRFDLIIDFQGLIKSAALAFIIGNKRVGFHRKNLRETGASFLYNHSPKSIDEKEHVIFKNIYLSKYMLKKYFDLDKISDKISYPALEVSDNKKIIAFMKKNSLKEKEFILINIGGGWETKTLRIDQYEKMIIFLKKKFTVVILWGNKKEKIIADTLIEKTGSIKTEFLNFSELFKLISMSKFIITSDTLALHIADIVKTKSIGIFGPTSPDRNGSLNPLSKVIYKKLSCSPCHKKQCRDIKCINRITEEDILESIKSINE